ncbi:guanine nucleotide-binding protein G(q) subunit alpha-like [Cochliomyia hominivorax]
MNCNCLYSEELKAQNRRNKVLENKLECYKRIYNRQIKLLLLGTSGSGKSTFLRQMRFAYNRNYFDNRSTYTILIHQHIFRAMDIMINAMKALDIPYETKENALKNTFLVKYANLNYPLLWKEEFLQAVKDLWADTGIQECYLRQREYDLMDSTKYFFNSIDRIAKEDYIPTDQDILRVRVPSNGPNEHLFNYKNVEFLITDVRIQRSERLKWMHCFDNVTSIVYMLAISEYDQNSLDSISNSHCNRNRLKDSLHLLKIIANYDNFQHIAIILVFNKLDIFEEKIMHTHLSDYFPEYTGPKYDPLAARSFILNTSLSMIPTNRRIYYYFISAIDLHNESIVFIYRAVRDAILNINLQYFNLV